MTAMSTASEASDSPLQTRAQLAGHVEVNFKSDYLPLEKMATPGHDRRDPGQFDTRSIPTSCPSARNPDAAGPGRTGARRHAAAAAA